MIQIMKMFVVPGLRYKIALKFNISTVHNLLWLTLWVTIWATKADEYPYCLSILEPPSRGKYFSLFPWHPSWKRFQISSILGKDFEMQIWKFWNFSRFLGKNLKRCRLWEQLCCQFAKIWNMPKTLNIILLLPS